MSASVHQHESFPEPQAVIAAERVRLQRYLPPEMFEGLADLPGHLALRQPYVHLAAARATIATYLPRLLVRQLVEERRQSPWLDWVEGSLLFADLSGSTALAEQLSALGREGTELVTEFLNHIFDTMIQVIQRYGGDLVAFGGDALLVFFGDPQHPLTATQAALALQEALHGYVKDVPNIGSFPMHLHVGVESGRVAFVSAGSPEALHYSVLGGAVNGVAAAEGLSGPGEIVVGPGVLRELSAVLSGVAVAPGYMRVTQLRAAHQYPAHQPELAPPSMIPERAIPVLLDDLDRLGAYIPDVLLSRILADPQRPQLEPDLRPVSVIFAQMVGLETLAETLPPRVAADAVQLYVSAMQEVVEQYGGVVNKLDVADQGIKLVAIVGAPTAYEDHAERAARAALAMRDRMGEVGQQILDLAAREAPGTAVAPLRQRIGLNLGTAFAGNVGSPARKEYTVMGDAVNVAARVMSKATWGEVWCSLMAARSIEARMLCDDRGAMQLKGKAVPLRLFQLRGERDTPDVVVNDMGRLVGRERELTWLLGHLDLVLGGEGRAVRIVGDAGVGKSRLAAELLQAARLRGATLIPAACYSYTSGIPYSAWGEWLKALCGIISGDDDRVRTQKLSAQLRGLGEGMEEWLPLFGDMVRLDIPENGLTRGLDPQLRQARRFDLLERMLLHAACEGPVVALFEDLHWADPISLDLWHRITGAISDRPILLIGMHRVTPVLAANNDHASVLELHELTASESAVLADQLAGEVSLPTAIQEQLVARSSGNPLFLAELVRAVAANIDADGAAIDLALDDLPDSLNGLLLSRIDRLDEISRSVLRIASVIGQRIPFGVLQSIQPADQKSLIRQLARLDSEEMTVLERIEPERVHTFRHALIQEVAYQSMLYARRRELHGRIGGYLEQRYANDLDDYYGLLAHHYRLSDRRDKAIDYLFLAGSAARVNYANAEAIQYFQWALDALAGDDQDPRAWEIRDSLGEVFETVGRYDDALAQHAAIIASPQVTPDIARRAHRKRGFVHEKQGLYVLALEEIDRAMTIAVSGVPGISPLALPRTYADLALVRQRLGEYDAAVVACEAGLASLRQTDRTRWDALIEADLHSILGGISGMRGDYPRAQHHFERCLRAREAADNLAGVSAVHSNLGYLWQLQSQYERALDHYHTAEGIARKLGLPYVLMTVLVNAADAQTKLGVLHEAESRCLAALELAKQISAQHMVAQIHNTLGIVYFYQGRYQQALEAYDEAQRIHQGLGSAYEEGDVLINRSLVYSTTGEAQEALDAARQALERAEAIQSPRLQAEALLAEAEAALLIGEPQQAAQLSQVALQLSEQIGSSYDEAVALRLLGQAAARRAEPFAAAFEQSIQLLNTIKHRFGLARTWAAYGRALIEAGNLTLGESYVIQAREAFTQIGAHGEIARITHEP